MLDPTAPWYKLRELTAHLKCPFAGLWEGLRLSSSHPSGSHSPSCPSPVQGCEFSPNAQLVTGMQQPACPHSKAMVISPRIVQVPLSQPSLLFSPFSKLLPV